MKGLVWGPTFEIADAKLNDIKQEYLLFNQYSIVKEINGNQRHIIEFNNGDIWKAVNFSESHRGERANISYVHRSLIEEHSSTHINGMIRNCTYAHPWHGFCIYG